MKKENLGKKVLKAVVAVSLVGGLMSSSLSAASIQALDDGKNKVTYNSQGVKLAGNLYTPANFDSSKKYPTIIFSGPFNQIKEQTGAVYAKKLIEKGYVVLVFDHLGFGDSEGKLRNFENPFIKMESIRDSISYLRTLDFVDRNKLYGLGVCASGGYMPIVAMTDKRLKAIASVSGMMDNTGYFYKAMGKDFLKKIYANANEERQKIYETGKVNYFDALGLESVDLSKLPKDSAQAEGYDYYMTKRAGKETYPNYTHLAPTNLMEYSPLTSAVLIAPYLNTPFLGIYGEKAKGTAPLTVDFYNKTTEPKELYEIKGASHVSLYDIDKDVQKAVDRMDEFFKKY